ncbi:MAG: phenylalanine--tRNA ligase subunit beta [Acidimicrobiia bacterium]
MKALLSWMREFAPLAKGVEEISEAFGALGTPVEEIEHVGRGLDGIVVAEVKDLRAHPNAERIQLVDVDAGAGDVLQVCCGAFNMKVGDLVPLATLGTVMPNGMEIARRKLRGQWSNGMLCSPPELGLPGDPGGILLLDGRVPAGTTLGTSLKEAFGIEADVVWDLEVNPNRPDAMSIAGLARDLAAWFGEPFTLPSPDIVEQGPAAADLVTVEVLDPERCGRFTARVLSGVVIGASPQRIATRLILLGMRPINNVVDASNYVMLELGQPSHPYDRARVAGPGFRVRRACEGEVVATLDGSQRTMTSEELLICDADDVPQGVGGVMGGAAAEIDDTTTDVLVEMAWFLPLGVAKSSRRLGLRSEASARFEKGADPEVIELAHARYIEVLGDAVGRVAPGVVDTRGTLPAHRPVRLRTARVNAVLGTELGAPDIAGLLEPIGFAPTPAGADLDVVIPSWRYDAEAEIDIVEEVARHHGYQNIGAVVPPSVHIGGLTRRQHERRRARAVLVGLGLSEAMPLPFLAPGDLARSGLDDQGITITNPLVAEESVLRTALLPGLLRTVAYNQSHRVAGAAFFEIGHVFLPPARPEPLPDEREHLAVAVAGAEAPDAVEVWDALAAALGPGEHRLQAAAPPGMHPTRSAEIILGTDRLGTVGEVGPEVLEQWGIAGRVAYLEVDLGRLLEFSYREHRYRPVSRFPSSDIDLAFDTADAVPAGDVEAAIRAAAGDLLVAIELFDVYRGPGIAEGRRSLAFRLRLQAVDRTLTDDEVGRLRSACVDAVESPLDARLR